VRDRISDESSAARAGTGDTGHGHAFEGLPLLLGGVVVEGDHRGRELGYPTANVAALNWRRMPEGVFAGTAQLEDGSLYRSAVSVGRRETFYATSAPVLVEAFLLDFDGNLYGQNLRVELLKLIRPQRRFDSVRELIERIEADVAFVRDEVKLVTPRPPRAVDRAGFDDSSAAYDVGGRAL
jgi:riboflavin kinase/FMN adenylyltransferase